MDWRRLFPDSDFRFPMALRPGNAGTFFSDENTAEYSNCTERYRWIDDENSNDGTEYVRAEETSLQGMRELESLVKIENVFDSQPQWTAYLVSFVLHLKYQPDWLLLNANADGVYRVTAGAVCFPSGWSLREAMGKSISEIHAIVPGLNEALGRQLNIFLAKLEPDVAWERDNWGLSADAELNHHPSRALKKLNAMATLETTWVRVERQLLYKLPRTNALVFGIRVSNHLLSEVAADAEIADRICRALRTMPREVAAYKGIESARATLIEQLNERFTKNG